MGVRDRAGMNVARHEARDMSHVDEKVGSDGVCDLPHAGEIDCASSKPMRRR